MNPVVLITDPVDPICIDMLRERGMEADVQVKQPKEVLLERAAHASGWIIRSGTTITAEMIAAAHNLKVIGRAGVGVDNIDVAAATRRGVLVINAPDGNTISTAEHTCAMLLSLARLVPQADASVKRDEWDRKSFTGTELYEKTLGVIGVGKIGQTVAQRMKGFGMTVVGYDPVLSPDVAERVGIELVSLDELYQRSDFITVHTPLNNATRSLLNRKTLARCKRGVRLVNCARGGVIDEKDLLEALNEGQVGGAALDVYTSEPPAEDLKPLLAHPRVVSTPHIAASTAEAQEKVAIQITDQVILAIQGEPVQNPVNGMAIKMTAQREIQPYLPLATRLGSIGGQLVGGNLKRVTVRCYGDIPHRYISALSLSTLSGVLGRWTDVPVNLINAPIIAEEMGLTVEEHVARDRVSYTNLVEVVLESSKGVTVVAGTVFEDGEPRLVRVDDWTLEVRMEGKLLVYRNVDRPGMLAAVGGLLAQANINIAGMALGRNEKGREAVTVMSVDNEVPAEVLEQISSMDGVHEVHVVAL
jgi:D-3-phosphoglycerate dehydrogenase / 2-oxoglutarate reductase